MSEITLPKPLSLNIDTVSISATATDNTYAYPMLHQSTVYRTGDEGSQRATLFGSIYGSNTLDRRNIIGKSDFYTLESNNSFGNTHVFTNSSGVEIADMTGSTSNLNTIIYDNCHGIQFQIRNDLNLSSSWEAAIDGARSYDDGSWYLMPKIIVDCLLDITNHSVGYFRLNKKVPFFARTWSSTTYSGNTNQAVGAGLLDPNDAA